LKFEKKGKIEFNHNLNRIDLLKKDINRSIKERY